MKPRIIYMGTPEFAVAPLNAIIEHGFDVAAVVTVPDKPSGRGLKLNESAVKQYAVTKGLPVLQPVSLKDPVFLKELEAMDADLFIVVAFRMLPKVVWSMPRMGTFNLHGSLLPQYRGAAPINWVIINGEKRSGVTTFFIDEKIDTGHILLRETCPIGERETIGSLYEQLMNMGAALVIKTICGLAAGDLKPQPQEHFLLQSGSNPNGEISKKEIIHDAPKITKELCRINWTCPAIEIDRLIRGLSPYPGATAVISNGIKSFDLKIFEAEPVTKQENRPEQSQPGKIVTDGKTYLHVHCGNGIISLQDIQAAGKKRMKIKDFLPGFRNIDSYKFIQEYK